MAFRVLSIDGGGMRGIYTATYLDALERAFATRRNLPGGLDIGKAFQLIVGTSTGAVIRCGLAKGVAPATMVNLYKLHGAKIFRRKLPSKFGWDFLTQLYSRPGDLKIGNEALKEALTDVFGTMTIREVWDQRGIALAVPAVNMGTYRSWVFKTPHIPKTDFRDDDYTLVDVCLASSAAPLFRSLAAIKRPHGEGSNVSLMAVSGEQPVLVALLEALRMSADRTTTSRFSRLAAVVNRRGDHRRSGAPRALRLKLGGGAAKVSLPHRSSLSTTWCGFSRRTKRSVRIIPSSEHIPGRCSSILISTRRAPGRSTHGPGAARCGYDEQ